jgi:hypothetical protein
MGSNVPAATMLPAEVCGLLQSKRCVAFVGSGPSILAGYPNWHSLVCDLCSCCGVDLSLAGNGNAADFLQLAEAALRADRIKYRRRLGEVFGKAVSVIPRLYKLLMRIPFKSYITLNFDPLLAEESRYLENPPCSIYPYPNLDRQHIGKRSIYYLHGYVGQSGIPEEVELVLAESEFAHAYRADGPLRQFLLPTLTHDPICFIGCELREPVFREVFRICGDQQKDLLRRGGTKVPPKYILLAHRAVALADNGTASGDARRLAQEQEDDEAAFYDSLGVTVVRYTPLDEAHTGLCESLETVARLPDVRAQTSFEEEDLV